MSYALYDVDGYVGDLCTTVGLSRLREEVGREKKSFPSLAAFLDEGASFITEELVSELDSFTSEDNNVLKTAKNLAKLVAESKTVIIINS